MKAIRREAKVTKRKTLKSGNAESGQRADAPGPIWPISIVVCHRWEKDANGSPLGPRSDARWKQLRSLIMAVVGEVRARAKSLPSGNVGLQIRLQRLRARHGQPLLATLRERISKADIVIADLADDADTAWNPNVLLEVGIALGLRKEEVGALFILKPEKMKNIADINGLLLTKYRPTTAGSSLNLLDKAGFNAAVRTRLLEVARERGMIGHPISPEIDVDE